MNMKWLAVAVVSVTLFGCAVENMPLPNAAATVTVDPKVERLKKQRDAIASFYKPMHVEDGDWLDSQKEAGETFEEYVGSNPTLPTQERRTIYIQPIGRFNDGQKRVIKLTADYMKVFYNLPVKVMPEKPLGNVPNEMQRLIEYKNNLQIRTSYFLDDVLPKLLPSDAAALIAFTSSDLYPGDTWAFVFGQASLEKRVGVWSLYRLSDLVLEKDNAADRLLTRTLKIAMHETGHMFSMRHCTKYECLMSGTNHLAETDRRPLDTCPECMAKLAWAMKYDPVERYNNLAEFWRRNGKANEAKRFSDMAAAVERTSD